MESEIQKQIEERLSELPEDVREAILSAELEKHIQDIGEKYGLHIDQVAVLQDETMLVMFGFFDQSTFANQIIEHVHVETAKAEKIASDITEQIFFPIRESIKKFTTEEVHVPKHDSSIVAEPASTVPLSSAETMLSEKTLTISTANTPRSPLVTPATINDPPKTGIYKTDPYREPVE